MRDQIDSVKAEGVTLTSYRLLARNQMVRATGEQAAATLAERTNVYQLKVELEGGSVVLKPGALQYLHGDIRPEIIQHDSKRSLIGRAVTAMMSKESIFGVKYTGKGVIWTEPTPNHFILGNIEKETDTLLLDDNAFYACSGGIDLGTHVHKTISGALSGNGLAQPKLSGRGAFVVQSPVPVDEIDEIELVDSTAVIDGDLMLMFSETLKISLETFLPGIASTGISGEGMVYKFRGTGSIWIMPTLPASARQETAATQRGR